MTKEKKALTLEFAPGCFDSFEGTQEELDEMVAEIHRMFESGEMEANARPVDIDELFEDEPEYAEKIVLALDNIDTSKRNLQ
jgi:hypothetical protein